MEMTRDDMRHLFDSLEGLLLRMNEVAEELEIIVQQEREAVREFNADLLVALTERRAFSHRVMGDLETRARSLLVSGGAPESMTIEAFIDFYAGSDAPRFQSLRRDLYERMTRLERDNAENFIRMHAAYDVTNSVLQHIGVVESKQTYAPGKAR